jgi:hypothetical protein
MGGSSGKAAAAGAHNAYFVVSGMNRCLHGGLQTYSRH